MGNDTFKVVFNQATEPPQMSAPCGEADIYGLSHHLRHDYFTGLPVRLAEFLLDEIQREQELVFRKERVILCLISGLPMTSSLLKRPPPFDNTLPSDAS